MRNTDECFFTAQMPNQALERRNLKVERKGNMGSVLESRQIRLLALRARRAYKAIPFTAAYSGLCLPYWAPTAFSKPETGLRIAEMRNAAATDARRRPGLQTGKTVGRRRTPSDPSCRRAKASQGRGKKEFRSDRNSSAEPFFLARHLPARYNCRNARHSRPNPRVRRNFYV